MTKKSLKESPATTRDAPATNWEAQAEQLKYSVKKEVEEGNLIEEALKSLQRSFTYEEEKRTHAEHQRTQLLIQLEDLERAAKDLKEEIRLARVQRKGEQSEDTDVDSDSDEEAGAFEQPDVDLGTTENLERLEFDQLLNELRDDDELPTDGHPTAMSVQQRLRILRELNQGINGTQPAKERSLVDIKEQHRRVVREWTRRDNSRLASFQITARFHLDEEHQQARQQGLATFLAGEEEMLEVVNTLIEKHLTEFVKSKILAREHLAQVFANTASFKGIMCDLIEVATFVQKGEGDFRALGDCLLQHIEAFSQYLESRKGSAVLLRAAGTKKKFSAFMKSVEISTEGLIQLQDRLATHFAEYPAKLVEFLPHLNEREYERVAEAVSEVTRTLELGGMPYTVPELSDRLQMYLVQFSFDWMGKDATFVSPGRALHAMASVRLRQADRSLEKRQFYLFSDSVVISRNYHQRQLFDCFIPLEHLTLWDVPPRSNNREYIIELVDLRSSTKLTMLCQTEAEQDMLVGATSSAIQELSWPSSAIEFDENNNIEFIWGSKF